MSRGVLFLLLFCCIYCQTFDMDFGNYLRHHKELSKKHTWVVRLRNTCHRIDITGTFSCLFKDPDVGERWYIYYFFETTDDALEWINKQNKDYLIDLVLFELKETPIEYKNFGNKIVTIQVTKDVPVEVPDEKFVLKIINNTTFLL